MNSLDAEPMMSLDKFIEQTGLGRRRSLDDNRAGLTAGKLARELTFK
jgi:hypothetical protein